MKEPPIKRNFAYKDKKHLRFNYHKSSDNMVMDSPTQDAVMYTNHLIIADKSNSERKRVLNRVSEYLVSMGGSIIPSREVEGEIKQGKNKYTFVSWDSRIPLKKNYLLGMFPTIPIVRDKKIYERKVLNLEESVQDVIYG
jgi:hypothetical protein